MGFFLGCGCGIIRWIELIEYTSEWNFRDEVDMIMLIGCATRHLGGTINVAFISDVIFAGLG